MKLQYNNGLANTHLLDRHKLTGFGSLVFGASVGKTARLHPEKKNNHLTSIV